MWESGHYVSYLSICLTRKISRAVAQSTMTQVLFLGLCFEAVALRRLACDGQRCWKPSATSRFLNSLMRSLAGKKSCEHQLRFGSLSVYPIIYDVFFLTSKMVVGPWDFWRINSTCRLVLVDWLSGWHVGGFPGWWPRSSTRGRTRVLSCNLC